jgi:hypothetical protein
MWERYETGNESWKTSYLILNYIENILEIKLGFSVLGYVLG